MKILADFHHDGLYNSLHRLFEKRFGYELYQPIGFDWYRKDFWKYSEKYPTVKQYLDIPNEANYLDDHYEIYEKRHDYTRKALTFQQFLEKDIDVIIASVNQHEEPYSKLIKEHKPNAKLIRQVGNVHDNVNYDICKNVMISASPRSIPQDVTAIFYHQEFDLNLFTYEEIYNNKNITSLMNCVPDSVDIPIYRKYKEELSEYTILRVTVFLSKSTLTISPKS